MIEEIPKNHFITYRVINAIIRFKIYPDQSKKATKLKATLRNNAINLANKGNKTGGMLILLRKKCYEEQHSTACKPFKYSHFRGYITNNYEEIIKKM